MTIEWNEASYLQKPYSVYGREYSTEDDGVDGIWNPRFEKGKRVIKTPKLTGKVIEDLVWDNERNSKGFYSPWYYIGNVSIDIENNRSIAEIICRETGIRKQAYKSYKRANSVWHLM